MGRKKRASSGTKERDEMDEILGKRMRPKHGKRKKKKKKRRIGPPKHVT